MKKIFLFILLFASLNANANDIEDTRSSVSSSLNDVVRHIKTQFSTVQSNVETNKEETTTLKQEVDDLVTRSGGSESNPTILKHGNKSIKSSCDYQTENLQWTGSSWICQEADVLSDCDAASDEYKVKKSDGSYSCQKNPSSSSINYYWKFYGYSKNCNSSTAQYSKIYGCFYKNKINQEIQVDNSYCSGKTKPSAVTKSCAASWSVSSWGSCSKSCGTGSQTRSVICPVGKVCLGTKPSTSQQCNTHVCTASWRTSSWSSCSKSCGGGTQTRSVTCPNGYVCNGVKPSSSQSCNTQQCTASWQVSGWSGCSKSCGGGTQTRSVSCPSGFKCTGTKPSPSQSCNTQACMCTYTDTKNLEYYCSNATQGNKKCWTLIGGTSYGHCRTPKCCIYACSNGHAPMPQNAMSRCPSGYSKSGSKCVKTYQAACR